MDPLSIIASTLAIVQSISSTYKAIQYLKGLPNEFIEVNRNLPLTQDTLTLARNHLQGLALNESSKEALQPVVSSCEEKAKMLLEIFEKVEKGVKNVKDGSVLDLYRTSLLRLGKAHRVETLMQGILRGLDALATNQLFRTATQSQVSQLQEAIDQMSTVESSVPESDFESGSNYQNIASGGTGYQSNITGQDHKINSGSGEQYNVSGDGHTISFVQSNDGDKTRSDIFQTLYTSPYLSRKNRNPDRVPGTCDWFIRHHDFQQWRESKSSSMLWVSANPGSGKSVLAKHLADCELKTTKSRTTCYFFFKDDFEDQKSATSAVCCLLHQLFAQKKDLFSRQIIERFEAYKAHLTNSFDELWEILVMALPDRNSGEVVCILDAFDECEDQERRKFSHALRTFYDPESNMKTKVNLKFLVTSRPYDKIGRGFQPLNIPRLPVIHLKGESNKEIQKIAREIDVYIEDRVSRIGIKLGLRSDEELLLLENLRHVPHQTYLWVYLTLDLIESDININKKKIREVTSSLPQTVDEAYEKILAKSSDSEEAKKLLHIIVAAARPLTVAEMDFALALRKHHTSYKHVDMRPEERFGRYIRDLCGLFVTIIDSKIYLLHQTAKEFLVPKDIPDPRSNHGHQLRWKSSLQPSESHCILFQICVWYLLFDEFETHPLDEEVDENSNGKLTDYLRNHVFLDYSATNWAIHFRASGIEDNSIIELLGRICDASSKRCLTWFKIYWMSTRTHMDFPRGFTTLMIASYFGLEQIVKLQICTSGVRVDSIDSTYQRSALSWASENGFDGVVKLLIEGRKITYQGIKLPFRKQAKIDTRDKYHRTPLSYAAWNGHMAVIQRLVRAKAEADSMDEIGGTPISYALCSGHEDVARQLMKESHSESAGRIRDELLISATKKGHVTIIQRLLANDAPTDVFDSAGLTPLIYAAEGGVKAIVKLLLDNGADVNATNGYHDRTPLSCAVQGGFQAIVKLLLENGADVNGTNGYHGQTPLSCAVQGRCEAIVKLLLENGADANRTDGYHGQILLSLAVQGRCEAIVKLLLDNGADVNNVEPGAGYTSLAYAINTWSTDIMEILLKNGAKADFSYMSQHGDFVTPLIQAIKRENYKAVELLLRYNARPDFIGGCRYTPLELAEKLGDDTIIRMLKDALESQYQLATKRSNETNPAT